MHEADLLTVRDLHGLVGEVYPFKEFGKLARRLSSRRGRSVKAFTVWRDMAGIVLISLFTYCEKLGASFDPSRVIWLATLCVEVSTRLLVSVWCCVLLVLVVDSVEARGECSLNWCCSPEACN